MPVKRLCKDDKGVSAIEFALIGPLFLLFTIGIIEFGLYFLKKNLVSHVLYEASRNIQTGEIQSSANPQQTFIDEYCADSPGFLRCNEISFDVRSFDSVAAVSFPAPVYDDAGNPQNFVFQPGSGEQITAMRASIPHQFITPLMRKYFQPTEDPALIVGHSIAKNEPF
ncbi:MAG: pilus assembly protein [Hyphomonadaceae bacterium]|nr:pilus assembly protein [Hyphomonadaceae bacterium]